MTSISASPRASVLRIVDQEPQQTASNIAEFEWLYRTHRAYVLGYLIKRTKGDRHLAEDILQETFLRAWRNPPAISDQAVSGRSWLVVVARRVLIDRVRQAARRPLETDDDFLEDVASSTHCYADDVLMALRVRAVLSTLTAQQRDVLELAYIHDLSARQMAPLLGIPVGTVKSRIFYALRALRRAMGDPVESDALDWAA